jgi:uncharacterized membrane protein
VLGGVFLAFVGIGLLIYFVHHVATAIQVDHIIQRIASDTAQAIDRVFPSREGEAPSSAPPARPMLPGGRWHDVAATRTGYVVAVDAQALVAQATEQRALLCVLPQVGDFVIEGRPVMQVAPLGGDPDEGWCRTLSSCVTVHGERHVDQDPAFGLQQIVDVALKALSPGVHDPTTAASCIDHLGALLHRLSGRQMPSSVREHDGQPRLVLAVPDYDQMVRVALAAVTHHAASHEPVHSGLIAAVAAASQASDEPQRLASLARQLEAHLASLPQAGLPAGVSDALRSQATALHAALHQRSAAGAQHGRESMRLGAVSGAAPSARPRPAPPA